MHFIIKLFPEITIKSTPVRKRFVKQLRDNLRNLLRGLDESIDVQRDWEKIEVRAPVDDQQLVSQVTEVLACTPGIANFAKVQSYPLGDMDDIFHKTKTLWGEALKGKTFCVRVKRNGQHPFSSIEVERYVGGGLNQHTEAAGVKLKNPDITVRLEIRENRLFILENLNPGLGGFPLGTQDPVLSLISGGFDSTVSSYLTIKRGLRTHYCFFNLGGRAHEVGVKEVAYYLWNKYGASHRVKFVTIPFDEVVSEILQHVENSLMGVVLKRMMLRAATKVAEEMKMQALVTGESVGQVSSQTLQNLSVIDAVTDTLVLRPLVTMDKGDIVNLSRKIGTEVYAAHMPEYCGVISVKPTTRARIDNVKNEEGKFDFSKLDMAIAKRQVMNIDDVLESVEATLVVQEVSTLRSNSVVVDIRHPDEEELAPFSIPGVTIKKIPFYTLNSVFPTLNKEQEYLLYCAQGVMSQLHAEHLMETGFNNVGVFRPDKKG